MDTIDHDETSSMPAEQQHPDEKKILRACSVNGEIDHAALIREFIARFPKIRAALAN
jgi:hypothetical protein